MNHKEVSDTWERGNPYERYAGRWSREVAPLFLSWLAVPAGRRWLDVGWWELTLQPATCQPPEPVPFAEVARAAAVNEALADARQLLL